MSDDKDNVIHVVFNPSKQTEADKINFNFTEDTIDFSGLDSYLERELDNILQFDERERKQYIEDLLALGYDEFTAFKLADDLCKSSTKKNPR